MQPQISDLQYMKIAFDPVDCCRSGDGSRQDYLVADVCGVGVHTVQRARGFANAGKIDGPMRPGPRTRQDEHETGAALDAATDTGGSSEESSDEGIPSHNGQQSPLSNSELG